MIVIIVTKSFFYFLFNLKVIQNILIRKFLETHISLKEISINLFYHFQ